MARLKPSLRTTETYTEPNFLRLSTEGEDAAENVVTLEHFRYAAGEGEPRGWSCLTIVDAESMSREDAVFIARSYAKEYSIPVIYECHAD